MKRNKRFNGNVGKNIAKNAAVLLACTLCVSNLLNSPVEVMAKSMPHKKEGKVLRKYLNMQASRYTNVLDKKLEDKLNASGMYDEDIEIMDEATVEKLEEAEVVNVVTEYYEVDEEGNSHIMTLEEIDEIIEQEYGDEIENYEGENIAEGVLQSLGLVPQTVHAAGYVSSSNYSASQCFKKTIVISQPKGGVYEAYLTAYYTWITAPQYREQDVASVFLEGADILKDGNNTCTYYYTRTEEKKRSSNFSLTSDIPPSSWTTVSSNVKGTETVSYTSSMKEKYKRNIGSCAYAYAIVDLKDNKVESLKTKDASYGLVYMETVTSIYTNHKIVIQLEIKKDENDKDNALTAYLDYRHKQTTTTLKPSISFSTSGSMSLGLSASQESKYHTMGEVLDPDFYWAKKATK